MYLDPTLVKTLLSCTKLFNVEINSTDKLIRFVNLPQRG